MPSGFTPQDLITIGAGGISFLILAGIVVYFIKSLNPTLTELKSQNNGYSSIIQNNTSAITELSRSNDNVAHALELLNVTYKDMKETIDHHTTQSEKMNIEIIKISERTQTCVNKKEV